MKRRTALALAGAGALAAAGTAWWTWGRRPDPAEAALAELLTQRYEAPDGTPLALSRWQGRPLLLNFWATWCPPCVREMPELDRFAREQGEAGVQVLAVALDRRDAVRDFLARTPVGFAVAVAGMDQLSRLSALGNPGGALPFSLLASAEGRIRRRKLGATQLDELRGWLS